MNAAVKVISTLLKDAERLIKFKRLGNDDIQEVVQVNPYGVDANPIKDMVAIYSPTLQQGQAVIIGYVNKNQLADVGEHRIFSTDADGALQFYLHLKNDGTAEFGGDTKNMVRYQELETAFNQLRDDFNSLVATYNAHTHVYAPGPGTPIPTPPPVGPGSPSAADITPARIDEIKTL